MLRSCYRGTWNLPGFGHVRGYYFFTPDHVGTFPGWHFFGSRNWHKGDGNEWPEFGELETTRQTWVNGAYIAAVLPPDGIVGTLAEIDGDGPFTTPRPEYLIGGLDRRCWTGIVDLTGRLKGGLRIGGRVKDSLLLHRLSGGLLLGGSLYDRRDRSSLVGGLLVGGSVAPGIKLPAVKGGNLLGKTLTTKQILAADAFAAADGTVINGRTPDVGVNWVKTAGTPKIISHAFVGGDALIACWFDSVTMSARITGSSVGGGAFGLLGRATALGSSYGFYLQPNVGTISIWLNDTTMLGSMAAGIVAGTAYDCVAVLAGHSLSWTVNGHTLNVSGASAHDGVPGMGATMNTATAWQMENFLVTK